MAIRFVGQAWHLATWTFIFCGRRGTYGAQLGLVTRLIAADAASFCVAGVALGRVEPRFVWQVWHLGHLAIWTFTFCGRRGTYGTQLGLATRLAAADAASLRVAGVALRDMDRHFVWRDPYGTGLGLVTRLGAADAASFCVAGVAFGTVDLRFVWQAWHLARWAFTLYGRCGTYGTGLGLVTCLVAFGAVALLRGRRGTW
eukprot:s1285_g18.t1